MNDGRENWRNADSKRRNGESGNCDKHGRMDAKEIMGDARAGKVRRKIAVIHITRVEKCTIPVINILALMIQDTRFPQLTKNVKTAIVIARNLI